MTSRVLLDTHVFLWWRSGDARLGRAFVKQITEAELVMVSAASAWECAIKMALGKLRLPGPFEDEVGASGFEGLPITMGHAEVAGALPQHHRDPFDRMLVAQATVEDLVLASHDRALEPYGLQMLWA